MAISHCLIVCVMCTQVDWLRDDCSLVSEGGASSHFDNQFFEIEFKYFRHSPQLLSSIDLLSLFCTTPLVVTIGELNEVPLKTNVRDIHLKYTNHESIVVFKVRLVGGIDADYLVYR